MKQHLFIYLSLMALHTSYNSGMEQSPDSKARAELSQVFKILQPPYEKVGEIITNVNEENIATWIQSVQEISRPTVLGCLLFKLLSEEKLSTDHLFSHLLSGETQTANTMKRFFNLRPQIVQSKPQNPLTISIPVRNDKIKPINFAIHDGSLLKLSAIDPTRPPQATFLVDLKGGKSSTIQLPGREHLPNNAVNFILLEKTGMDCIGMFQDCLDRSHLKSGYRLLYRAIQEREQKLIIPEWCGKLKFDKNMPFLEPEIFYAWALKDSKD